MVYLSSQAMLVCALLDVRRIITFMITFYLALFVVDTQHLLTATTNHI